MTGAGSDPRGSRTTVGVLGGTRDATVDRSGVLSPRATTWELDWWIGADDRWRVPAREVALRQQLVDGMPVVQTATRVPGGDALHRVYGVPVADVGEVAVVEIVNDSPAPFVAALVVRGATALDLDAATVWVDGRAALRTARPPSRWAASVDGSTEETVVNGAASQGAFPHRQDRGARLVGAFLFPVAHRTALRAVVNLGPRGIGASEPADLPDAPAVARGWRAQLDRGMRVVLPDEQLQRTVDTARAMAVLAGQAWRVDPPVAGVLEDWGLDAEAAVAWDRLTGRARRRLAKRDRITATWSEVRARAADAGADASLLSVLRAVLVQEHESSVALLGDWPGEWFGRPLDLRDAPTRHGSVSCSVRWHGDRCALLWEGPAGVVYSAPGLDPTWSSSAARGEALLAPFAPRRRD
jgi:hypothetical protein